MVISGNSLVFSRKIVTSAGFYRCCALGAPAPVVVKNQSPRTGFQFFTGPSLHRLLLAGAEWRSALVSSTVVSALLGGRFLGKAEKRHCSQQSPQQSPSSRHSPRHCCFVDLPRFQWIRADFREGDEDSNFSLFRVRRFIESPGPLH